ncbi:uncharacterized protein K452DRAFT_292269 [Aplosporella prunicola CBS 121167]|uniref:Heterokaryon incompatibility domain-containing protein n=1 Tax=Aplosporella prunicola CBS 121167 TaxID=1176127 RepID=A0A6A6AXC2_9PEZI|nr:uncharacterized protein K452DRAFT_292269 [Aplosporella prunicola CBS 121167]KAF2136612.1 hypothetical protein K452DRAFT_292269 [Aplosporella prunicola CBS 121167]
MSIYAPLEQGEFRLLNLASGLWDEDIECGLIQIPLRYKPTFDALSYAWGSPEAIRSVGLNS